MCAINAELELVSGDADSIVSEVETRLNAMFLDPSPVTNIAPLQIGEDLTRDRLVAEIMVVTGIKRINWTTPGEDVAVEEDGLASLESITLSYSWADEI